MFGNIKHSKEGNAWDSKSKAAASNKHPLNYGGSGNTISKGIGTHPAKRDLIDKATDI